MTDYSQPQLPDAEGVVTASDGLPALSVGPWWAEKHHYIRRYQDIFSTGMANKWPNRYYVDLFAGPGRCVIQKTGEEIDGSPLVAALGKKPFAHYYFNEQNPALADALKTRFESISKNGNYYTGDANDKIDDVLVDLPDARTSLGLAFLDPFGWELNFKTIEKLSRNRRIDLMITFHTGQLRRWADSRPELLDNFFGREAWRDEYRKQRTGPRQERALLDAYESGLNAIGYKSTDDEIIVTTASRRLLYHLVFASKDPKGKEFWRKISRKSAAGQGKLL